MGAATRQNEHTDKYMEVGKGITNTCHESYIRTPTQLGPEAFRLVSEAFNHHHHLIVFVLAASAMRPRRVPCAPRRNTTYSGRRHSRAISCCGA